MKSFIAYTNGLELARELNHVVAAVKRKSFELGDQIDRARISVVLNVAEGARRLGRDRQRFYAMAAGSASELVGALELASVLFGVQADRANQLLDRERALLWGLTRAGGSAATAKRAVDR